MAIFFAKTSLGKERPPRSYLYAVGVLKISIASVLYGVSATDPISVGMSALELGLAAILACLFPARRATQIDPITVLRE